MRIVKPASSLSMLSFTVTAGCRVSRQGFGILRTSEMFYAGPQDAGRRAEGMSYVGTDRVAFFSRVGSLRAEASAKYHGTLHVIS